MGEMERVAKVYRTRQTCSCAAVVAEYETVVCRLLLESQHAKQKEL
jgi:hypothetical protein